MSDNFFLKNLLFYSFMDAMVGKEIYSPFQIYIYFVWVKINNERDIIIMTGEVMCILSFLVI